MKDDAEVLACAFEGFICCYPRERKTVGRAVWRGARFGHFKFDMPINIHVDKSMDKWICKSGLRG